MRAAPQVQPQIDNSCGHPADPAVDGGLLIGSRGAALGRDGGSRIVVDLDPGIKRIGQGIEKPDQGQTQNQHPLP